MSPSCPISLNRIDSNMVRVIAFEVALFTIMFIFTQESFFAVVLLFDFLIRALRLNYLSPFGLFANFILSLSSLTPKLCDESPKRFALYLGLIISSAIVLFFMVGFSTTAMAISAVLLVCSILEMAFDFCIGCKIYYYIVLIQRRLIK